MCFQIHLKKKKTDILLHLLLLAIFPVYIYIYIAFSGDEFLPSVMVIVLAVIWAYLLYGLLARSGVTVENDTISVRYMSRIHLKCPIAQVLEFTRLESQVVEALPVFTKWSWSLFGDVPVYRLILSNKTVYLQLPDTDAERLQKALSAYLNKGEG